MLRAKEGGRACARSWGKRYSSSLLAAPLHQVAACFLPPGLVPLTCTASLGRKVVWKWPWTTKILECLCFVVLCDEGDVQTSESQPWRFEGMRPTTQDRNAQRWGQFVPHQALHSDHQCVWLVTFQAHPTCRSVLPPFPPPGWVASITPLPGWVASRMQCPQGPVFSMLQSLPGDTGLQASDLSPRIVKRVWVFCS